MTRAWLYSDQSRLKRENLSQLWVLNREDLNFCVLGSPLRDGGGRKRRDGAEDKDEEGNGGSRGGREKRVSSGAGDGMTNRVPYRMDFSARFFTSRWDCYSWMVDCGCDFFEKGLFFFLLECIITQRLEQSITAYALCKFSISTLFHQMIVIIIWQVMLIFFFFLASWLWKIRLHCHWLRCLSSWWWWEGVGGMVTLYFFADKQIPGILFD